jgi:Ca-activated chloride channel family protein
MAASVAALAIAAPAAFQALRQSATKYPVASAPVEQAPIKQKIAEPPAPAPRSGEIAAPPPAAANPTVAERPAEPQSTTADKLAPPPPPAAPVTLAPPPAAATPFSAIERAVKEAEARASGERKRAATPERFGALIDKGRLSAVAPPPAPQPEAHAIQAGKPSPGTLHGAQQPDARTATLAPPRQDPAPVPPQAEEHRDQFQGAPDNPVKQVAQEPVSTFSLDVDTASYSFMRRALNSGVLPPKDAVRVEELINYFPYDYARPETAEVPFQPSVSVFPAPWNTDHKLVHIGIKGYEIRAAERPHANLVLLIDTSGSMSPQDRLPLVKNAFRMLVDELKPDDTISIVTYAGDTRVALEPTKVADKARIVAAIDGLGASGGTYGEGGIKKAYELAEAGFDPKGVNRIVLATDGDFNIGISNRDELKGFIERKRGKGIFLSVIGVGRGNYNDAMMQALAQNGNGTAAYVDTLNEARKVLVDEASSTLFPIAKDVKIQVEFNPAVVSEYRLIGYETRMLKREDFSNDKVDAGDVGSGHSVTAIYEITPVGAPPGADALRYAKPAAGAGPSAGEGGDGKGGEYGFLKMRYKLPKEDTSRLLTLPINAGLEKKSIAEAPAEARFSTAVAGFGQLLRGSPYLKSFGYDDVIALGQTGKGDDPFGYRAEFLNLVRLAKSARP